MAEQELAENYAGTYSGRLEPGRKPALLLVDMVTAYLEPSSPFYCATATDAAGTAARLLRAARRAGRLVVFTRVEYVPGGDNGGLFYRKVPALAAFDRGSPLGRFPQALTPLVREPVMTKQYPSAFFGTGLADLLRAQGVDTLLIAGYSTSGCVRASALDALQHGFAPFVVRDACADRHAQPHEQNLFDLQAKYAEVIGETQALDILTRQP